MGRECDLVQSLASLPAIPHQGLLAVDLIDPLPALHLQYSCCLWQSSVCYIDQLNPGPKEGARSEVCWLVRS